MAIVLRTHWHVTKRMYSVKVGSTPVYYVSDLWLRNVRFVVDERLRARFETRPSRRTVHALVKGELVPLAVPEPRFFRGEEVLCNPFRFRGFLRACDLAAVTSADELILTAISARSRSVGGGESG